MANDRPSIPSRHWLKSLTAYTLYTVLTTTLGPLQFGFHIAELNTPQDVLSCKSQTRTPSSTITPTSSTTPTTPSSHPLSPRSSANLDPTFNLPQCIPMTPLQLGLITSIFTLGGLLGALSGGPLSTSHGRKPLMQGSAACFILGSVFEATAMNVASLSAGRFLSGIGAGAALVVVPIYISEISPAEGRGRLGALTQVMINLGVFTAVLLGYFLSHGSVWRIILAVGVVIGSLFGLGLLGVGESPRWLAAEGRSEDARRVLGRLRGGDGAVDEEIKAWSKRDENDDDRSAHQHAGGEEREALLSPSAVSKSDPDSQQHIGILALPSHRALRPAFLAILIAQSAQQLTGINSVIMYSVPLLTPLLPSLAPLLTVLIALTNLVATVLLAPLLDLLGRRSCLLLSITIMATSAFVLALAMTLSIPALAGIATLTFVIGFATGLGPVPFMLAAELVGPHAVGSLQSWGLSANWITTFLVAQFLPPMSLAVGQGGVYFLFGTLGVLFFGLVWWFVPETRGCGGCEEVWRRFGEGRGGKRKGKGRERGGEGEDN